MIQVSSIKNKLLLMYMLVTGLVLASAFVIFMSLNITAYRTNIISSLNILGEIVADRCSSSVAFSDVESANSNLISLGSHENIVYACIRTVEGKEFAEYTPESSNVYQCDEYQQNKTINYSADYVDVYNPILLDGREIAVLQIKATLDTVTESAISSAKILAAIFFGLMFFAIIISNRVMNLITKPITQLKDIAQKVTHNKDFSLRVEKSSNDEVGVLVDSFNKMLNQIQKRDEELIEETKRAEDAALSAKKYALEIENFNIDLENEINERSRIEHELKHLNETLEEKVHERTEELKKLNEKIGNIARSAGMAEVASGVLHNVGNVLNSVNVSASVIRENVRKSKAVNLSRVVDMLEENHADIAGFIAHSEKGKQIPKFLALLSQQIESEKSLMFQELDELAKNIDHIKNVISMQQSYAGNYGVREKIAFSDLVEDALKINSQGMVRYGIEVIKTYADVPLLYIDKHMALQVIINLISNAKYALADSNGDEKKIFIIITVEDEAVSVEVKDTGVGITEEDIGHLFEYGFKKRREGHGFGLHHSALIANKLGGKIIVHSDGLGLGASFKLIIPLENLMEEKDNGRI